MFEGKKKLGIEIELLQSSRHDRLMYAFVREKKAVPKHLAYGHLILPLSMHFCTLQMYGDLTRKDYVGDLQIDLKIVVQCLTN